MSAKEVFDKWRNGRNINHLDPLAVFKAGLEAAAKACDDLQRDNGVCTEEAAEAIRKLKDD